MKIMHVIDSGGLYGAERMILALASESVRCGEECTIASIASPEDEQRELMTEAGRYGLEAIEFVLRDGLQLREFRRILRTCVDRGIDVLHTHGYRANILAGLSSHPARYARVTTLHGWTGVRTLSRLRIYETVERFLLGRFDAIVAVSPTMARHPALRLFSRHISVIPNGIRLQTDKAAMDDEIVSFARSRPTIVSAGRLSYEKGYDRLIKAFTIVREQHPLAQLVIFGDGPERSRLRKLIAERSLEDCVRLCGFSNSFRACLPEFRQFVLPSRTEGLPLVVLEAMAAGVPVVATDVGAVPWLLEKGAGIIVNRRNAETELAHSMSALLADDAVGARMAQAARRRVDERFTAKRMTAGYLQLYSKCIESRRRARARPT